MMVPVGRLVLLRSVPASEVVQALATLTIPALIGPVIGPPLGGFITTYFHWRWIFFINIPIGILGIVLSTLYIPNISEDDAAPRLHRLPPLRLRLRAAHAGLSPPAGGISSRRRCPSPAWSSARCASSSMSSMPGRARAGPAL